MGLIQHPLSPVFSNEDFDRLSQGRCPRSGALADPDISGMLSREPSLFEHALGKWFDNAAQRNPSAAKDFRCRLRADVKCRAAFLQTAGELMAAFFLEQQLGFGLTYVPRQNTKTPDFRLKKSGIDLDAEVKTMVGGIPLSIRRYCGAGPAPVPIVKGALKEAAKQLDKRATNLVLLVDDWRPPVDPDDVIEALYGTTILTMPVDDNGPAGDWHLERQRDGITKPDVHTRIGAVGLLQWRGHPEASEVSAVFVHNAFALLPLDPELLDPWAQLVVADDGGQLEWRNPVEKRS